MAITARKHSTRIFRIMRERYYVLASNTVRCSSGASNSETRIPFV